MNFANIRKSIFLLAAFALLTVGLLALTQSLTKEKIQLNKLNALKKALLEVLPQNQFDNNISHSTVPVQSPLLGTKKSRMAYVATLENTPSAIVFQTTANEGYNGNIELLLSISWQGEVLGLRALSHKETPGLGDKINYNKSRWVESFQGLSLSNTPAQLWAVKKDGGRFDSFTGATITPRAVIKGVQQTLQYFEENKTAIAQKHTRLFTEQFTEKATETTLEKTVEQNL